MKIKKIYFVHLFSFGLATIAQANNVGVVTPTSITIPITQIKMTPVSGSSVVIVSNSNNITFNSADADFAAVQISAASFPPGRYTGITVAYNTNWSVKLNGVKYFGPTVSGCTDNSSLLWTTGTSASSSAFVVSATQPAQAVNTINNLTVGNGGSTALQSTSAFANVTCIPTDGAKGGCQASDTIITGAPSINLMLDMYHSIVADCANGSLQSTANYPYAVLGKPGAAIHLGSAPPTGGNYSNVTLLFGPGKVLLYVASANSTVSGVTGLPSGVAGVNLTAATGPGAPAITGQTQMLNYFDPATGNVIFPTALCQPNCVSQGLVTLANVAQAVGSTVNATCATDTTGATINGVTYSYAGGNCSMGAGPTALTVRRIVDPGNMFGVCSGSCGSYP